SELIDKLENTFDYKVDLLVISEDNNVSVKDVQSYFDHFIYSNKLLSSNDFLINLENNEIGVLINNEQAKAEFKRVYTNLQLFLIKVGISNQIKTIETQVIQKVKTVAGSSNTQSRPAENKVFDYGLRNDYEKVNISELKDGLDKVDISGQVFKLDNRKLKSGKYLQILTIKDDTGAFVVKRFEGRRHSEEDILSIKAGNYINVKGNLQYDSFSKSNNVMADAIGKIGKINEIFDNEVEKRIELHAHTNRSEMDGIATVESLLDQAYKFKHEAIAITDHMVIQAYPAAYNHLKRLRAQDPEREFKVLYGAEFNIVEDESHIIRNYSKEQEIDDTFIVFDIETTGLSNRYNEIIEFGAVKVSNSQIVDRLQFFIKPDGEISAAITELTSIDNSHVANAYPIENEINRIKDFFADHAIVAHNATFDYDFINAKLEDLKMDKLTNTVIDTMLLSRLLNPQRRYHNLGSVARFYSIPYDGDVAHRADYDAEITANVLISMLAQLRENKVTKYADIMDSITKEFLVNAFDNQMTVLVKNQDGLKDMYELVTKSHTEEIAITSNGAGESDEVVAKPRLLRSSISAKRENLLIGSSSQNGLLFEMALNKSQSALEAEMQYYDYVEVMPPENYRNLVTRFQFDEKLIIETLENIVYTAKRLNKIVVATGDVHYLEPSDKIIRDIYINANGIGGVRHPLYIRNRNLRVNSSVPDQHFRTTKEMLDAFKFLPYDIIDEIVITNPKKISDSIEDVKPLKDKLFTPSIDNAA
ncbi:MAG: PHP domain-containing protein, partial [Alcaligenaceae bacterium]|nr:PHP domain-containing protein [Alcaligenaceae bacterium]